VHFTGADQAADAVTHGVSRWLDAVKGWKNLATDTSFASNPVCTEANDLALRMGRLTSGDPEWDSR
jgi:hypothetical protein